MDKEKYIVEVINGITTVSEKSELREKPKEKRTDRIDLPGGHSGIVYLILVEEPGHEEDFIDEKAFVASQIIKGPSYIEFKGFELKTYDDYCYMSKCTNYKDIVDYANIKNLEIVDMLYPYNRVICIKNLTYKVKK